MFLLAVLFYGETITPDEIVISAFIWLALAVFIFDAVVATLRSRRAIKQQAI
nr:chloramphenicol resistance permease RarD [Candidatus Pantoea persica]